jgi:hypothetical protein
LASVQRTTSAFAARAANRSGMRTREVRMRRF